MTSSLKKDVIFKVRKNALLFKHLYNCVQTYISEDQFQGIMIYTMKTGDSRHTVPSIKRSPSPNMKRQKHIVGVELKYTAMNFKPF